MNLNYKEQEWIGDRRTVYVQKCLGEEKKGERDLGNSCHTCEVHCWWSKYF